MNDARGNSRPAEDRRRAHQAHRGPAAAHRARRLYRRPAGAAGGACGVPPERTIARAHPRHRLRGSARRAGRHRRVHGGRFTRRGQAGGRDLAHGELLRHADFSAGARQGAPCRRAGRRRRRREPLPGGRRGGVDRHRLRTAAARRRSGTGGARRRAAVARGGRHQRHRQPRIQARRCRGGIGIGRGARRRPLPHASQEPGGDRAALLSRRIRATTR